MLFISIALGQLIKIPSGNYGGITLIDFTISLVALTSLVKLKFLKVAPFYIKSALVFILICAVSLLLTPLTLTTNQYLISLSYILRFGAFTFFGFFLYFSPDQFKNKIPSVFLYSGITLSVLGVLQIIFFPSLSFLEQFGWDPHFFRAVSTFLDPNFLGGFMVLTLLSFFPNHTIKKNWTVMLFLIVFATLLLTFSRSSYIMFFVSFLTLSVLRKSIKLFSLTIILSLILYGANFFYNNIIAAPKNIDREVSANYRVMSWQTGLSVFEKSPLLGIGFNSYKYALDEYDLIPQRFIEGRAATGNDSSLIFVLATTGILGLVSYFVLLISLLIHGFQSMKSKNNYGIIFIAGLLGLVAQSFFINALFYPFYLFWIFTLAAISKPKA